MRSYSSYRELFNDKLELIRGKRKNDSSLYLEKDRFYGFHFVFNVIGRAEIAQ